MNDRLMSAISLCRKAGKLKMGGDVVKEAALSGEARLVLIASDLAERSEKQIRQVCEGSGTRLESLPLTMEQLWQVTGKKYGILAVCDQGFAKMIDGLVKRES